MWLLLTHSAAAATHNSSDTPAVALKRRRFTLALYRWRSPRVPLRGDRYASSGKSGANKNDGGFGGFGIVDQGFYELGVAIGRDRDIFSGSGCEELAGLVV